MPGTRSARVRKVFDGGALGFVDDRKRGEAGRGGSSPIGFVDDRKRGEAGRGGSSPIGFGGGGRNDDPEFDCGRSDSAPAG
jgi:hypothetical protein